MESTHNFFRCGYHNGKSPKVEPGAQTQYECDNQKPQNGPSFWSPAPSPAVKCEQHGDEAHAQHELQSDLGEVVGHR